MFFVGEGLCALPFCFKHKFYFSKTFPYFCRDKCITPHPSAMPTPSPQGEGKQKPFGEFRFSPLRRWIDRRSREATLGCPPQTTKGHPWNPPKYVGNAFMHSVTKRINLFPAIWIRNKNRRGRCPRPNASKKSKRKTRKPKKIKKNHWNF